MSDKIVVLRVFDNEVEARMTQQRLQDAGVATFIFKDDGGGMEPHLQRTIGVRLMLNSADTERAQDLLQTFENTPPSVSEAFKP
jgi:hypothetical protein